jgi:hypothetical protein
MLACDVVVLAVPDIAFVQYFYWQLQIPNSNAPRCCASYNNISSATLGMLVVFVQRCVVVMPRLVMVELGCGEVMDHCGKARVATF